MQLHRGQFHKLLTGFRTKSISFLINVWSTLFTEQKTGQSVWEQAGKKRCCVGSNHIWMFLRPTSCWRVQINKINSSTKTTLNAQNRFLKSHFMLHRYKSNVKQNIHPPPFFLKFPLWSGHTQRNCGFLCTDRANIVDESLFLKLWLACCDCKLVYLHRANCKSLASSNLPDSSRCKRKKKFQYMPVKPKL